MAERDDQVLATAGADKARNLYQRLGLVEAEQLQDGSRFYHPKVGDYVDDSHYCEPCPILCIRGRVVPFSSQ